MSDTPPVVDYEDVRPFVLDDDEQEQLLSAHNECTFVWATKDGWPVGVTMSYVWRDGRIWLTTSAQRQRVHAVRRDPRVSVIVTSSGLPEGPGRTVTLKGRCTVHDDAATKSWFLPALAEKVFPGDQTRQKRFVTLLDSPRRVVFEVTPVATISHDVGKLGRAASKARRAGSWAESD